MERNLYMMRHAPYDHLFGDPFYLARFQEASPRSLEYVWECCKFSSEEQFHTW